MFFLKVFKILKKKKLSLKTPYIWLWAYTFPFSPNRPLVNLLCVCYPKVMEKLKATYYKVFFLSIVMFIPPIQTSTQDISLNILK